MRVTLAHRIRQKLALVEAQKTLSGEYWYTDYGDLLVATDGGDYNHEGHVMETIISQLCDVIGIENNYETDAVWLRSDLSDNWAQYGLDEDDPLRDAFTRLQRQSGWSDDQVADARALIGSNQGDARDFAIKYWGWVRIAGDHIQIKDLTPASLKRAAEAYRDAWFDEDDSEMDEEDLLDTKVWVSAGSRRVSLSLSDLIDGRLSGGSDGDIDAMSSNARKQVQQMDDALMHPFYRGRQESVK